MLAHLDLDAGHIQPVDVPGVARMMEEQMLRASTPLPKSGAASAVELLEAAGSRVPALMPINTPAAMVQTMPQAES